MGPRLMINDIKPSMVHAKYYFGYNFQTHEESNNNARLVKSLLVQLKMLKENLIQ